MPRYRVNITVDQKGAIFSTSKTKAAAQRAVTGINDTLAQAGVTLIKSYLGAVLINPTGFYESNIQVDRGQQSRFVSDNGVSYGGWLEGIDPRNSTTRFKGYSAFRRAKQQLQKDKVQLAQPYVSRLVNDLS